MFQLDGLLNQIEELRLSTLEVQQNKSYTDPEVVAACHELHAALDRYEGIMMRIEDEVKKTRLLKQPCDVE
ncbi:aspartyl-phosphate phosphatase Spo0E family protein [Desulfosporosinus sp. OT]|uniref:aspartyl-phosphate phosphatase Spo0E family protein n=1 Tax=Desulfosporosinus sp. OT TaxID=913865 RepID=UPI000223AA17|nr:aspartyl-phosphate phosphatase Spo0E family protein [Desulfosporosinus sp. OT]EGW41224.1 hypothetical protein DOT_0864 [Desulfosporosinus sp. OT]